MGTLLVILMWTALLWLGLGLSAYLTGVTIFLFLVHDYPHDRSRWDVFDWRIVLICVLYGPLSFFLSVIVFFLELSNCVVQIVGSLKTKYIEWKKKGGGDKK
jgi:hypothetical protein